MRIEVLIAQVLSVILSALSVCVRVHHLKLDSLPPTPIRIVLRVTHSIILLF